MKPLNHAVVNFKESIFSTMTKLALSHQAINLSQGFPDFDGPSWVVDMAVKALREEKTSMPLVWSAKFKRSYCSQLSTLLWD